MRWRHRSADEHAAAGWTEKKGAWHAALDLTLFVAPNHQPHATPCCGTPPSPLLSVGKHVLWAWVCDFAAAGAQFTQCYQIAGKRVVSRWLSGLYDSGVLPNGTAQAARVHT